MNTQPAETVKAIPKWEVHYPYIKDEKGEPILKCMGSFEDSFLASQAPSLKSQRDELLTQLESVLQFLLPMAYPNRGYMPPQSPEIRTVYDTAKSAAMNARKGNA